MKPKIIFIHGMFLNPDSWEHWIGYFERLGYECSAPAWPLHEGNPAQLRRNIPPGLGKLTLADLHAHYRSILSQESEPPVVIGHSLGGLLVQKLAADGLIRAGVAICPVAPNKMISADWSFLRNTVSITNPLAGDDPFEMTPEGFHKNFGNMMSEEESQLAYEKFAVHESRQVLRDIMGDEGEIDMEKPHVPLLFIAGKEDEIIPHTLVLRNAHAYKDERSHHEYTDFTGRGHFICGEKNWEEVAENVQNWLKPHLGSVRS